jgi:hypothetical protein
MYKSLISPKLIISGMRKLYKSPLDIITTAR